MSIIIKITVRFFHPIYHDKGFLFFAFHFCLFFCCCWSRCIVNQYTNSIYGRRDTQVDKVCPAHHHDGLLYSHQQPAAGVSDSIFFVCLTWSTRRGGKKNKHITARKRKSCKTENGLSGGGIRNEKKKRTKKLNLLVQFSLQGWLPLR